jgi:hypothetical protein
MGVAPRQAEAFFGWLAQRGISEEAAMTALPQLMREYSQQHRPDPPKPTTKALARALADTK